MVKVFISPNYEGVPKHADNGGIRRVVEAMLEHLPKFGIEIVSNPDFADVICNHGSMLTERKGKPTVNVNHGFYWSRQPWGDGYYEVNAQLTESMAHAVAHTAPSKWVANAIRRGGYWYPEVVYHGVDADDFKPVNKYEDYILWNKARQDYVSDPKDMMTLANYVPTRQFRTTLGRTADNVKVLGVLPHDQMKSVLSNAGLYLCTARETFGIGTLEAMAYGVPVIGWMWGGQEEIIQQGVTGYLAPPGDYKVLAEMVEKAFSERSRLSENCIQDVRENWKWEPRIQQYADIFKRVALQSRLDRPKVSVIVTAYKLDQYLPKCLDSVSGQTFTDFECLVIDNAASKSTKMIVGEYEKIDSRIRYIPSPNNFGLVGARNFGLAQSRGIYIRHLDGDDWLAPNAIELEATALDADMGVHIVYGHMAIANEDGSIKQDRAGWPEHQFNWYKQMAHLNQLPSCSMARREVYERSGGYRERMRRNEDAEFWCRVTSLGFRAKKFTEAVTYFHRERNDSKGAIEWKNEGGEPDWTAWFPWRMGANDYRTATEVFKKRGESHPNPELVPFGAQGEPTGIKHWHVHDFAYPVVSVIVTVGPSHEQYMMDALDSVQAQRFIDWECIVVNDTGDKWNSDIMGAPWAKVVNMNGNQGAAAARNEGFKHAKGKYIIWLDGDDYWFPWTLEKMVGYAEENFGVIFSDFISSEVENQPFKLYRYDNFSPERVAITMQYPGSSVLYPRKIVEDIFKKQNGFDTEIPGMEDWDFQVAVHDLKYCAYHIPDALFVYRMYSSTKRENDYNKIEQIREYMNRKWDKYRSGKEKIMCGCMKTKLPVGKPKSSLSSSGNFAQDVSKVAESTDQTSMVMVEYVGPIAETFSIRSRISRDVTYRFGNNPNHKQKMTFLGDAEYLLGFTDKDLKPMYRILGATTAPTVNDPAAFLGQEIVA